MDVGCRLSVIGGERLEGVYWRSVVGHGLLSVGCWVVDVECVLCYVGCLSVVVV